MSAEEDDEFDIYEVKDGTGVSHVLKKRIGEPPTLRCCNCDD
jgi:hypothetical protein